MTILSFTTNTAGQIGVDPRRIAIKCTDSLATVTTAGFIQNTTGGTKNLNPSDVIEMYYLWNTDSNTGTFGIFTVAIDTDGVCTLTEWVDPGDIVTPTVANRIAHAVGTNGQLSTAAANVTNAGNISAGLSGTAGTLSSFPSTAAKGSLKLTAVANTGDTVTTISNAAMGQASVVSIPDPAAATANFVVAPAALVSGNLVKASGTAGLVSDVGARIIANTTASYAGGGTSNAYAATGLTVNSKGSAVIRASTNAVSICKALPGTDTLTITFSSDPGASTTVDYIYSTAAI